jgi:hypothetical protein
MDKKELINTLIEVLNAPEKKDITCEDVKAWLHEKATQEDVRRLLQQDNCYMIEALDGYYHARVHDDEEYLNVNTANVDDICNIVADSNRQALIERLWDDLPASDRREFVLNYLENTL